MRRVLIIAYYFPPLGGMASMRVAGFAQHLPDYGWEPTVLTPHSGAYLRDPEFAFPEDRVVRSPSIEISRLAKRTLRVGGDDVRAAEVGPLASRLQRLARSYIYYPDAQIGWYIPAVVTGRRLMRRPSFDAIVSSSAPITAHLIARRLGRRLPIPWLADFRDPWSALIPEGAPSRQRAAALERSLARAATAVTMTSPSWAAEHERVWGRRVEVITNGYTPGARRPAQASDGFVIGYLGTLYPADRQDLSSLWEAVRTQAQSAAAPVDRIRFIGNEPPGLRTRLEALGLGQLLEVTGYMSHAEAIACLKRSSALVLAGPVDASGIRAGEIPGKVFEYLATDLPIIYIGDPRSDAAALLRDQPGCFVRAVADVSGIAEALTASRGARFERDVSELSRPALTARLARLLDGVSVGQLAPLVA